MLGESVIPQRREHLTRPRPAIDRSADSATPLYEDMKCLSIRQPWAWLIVTGIKDIENRTWNTPYRGPLLIHAGQSLAPGFREICAAIEDMGIALPDQWERGAIVGKVDLVDVLTQKRWFRDAWFDGPYGFVLSNAQPLPPMPAKGQLNLYTATYRQPE